MLLQLGDKGDNVKYLQYGLHILCCSPNGFDGEFGNGTLTAVKKFQSKYGLVSDGIVGDVTWNTLKNEIATIQAQLNKKGCSVGTVDGIAGPATYNAVISFQNKNGLTADGQVGTATWDILFDTVSGGTTYTRILKVTSPLMQGDDVKAVQNKLNSLGYNCGTADGYYGNATKSAVISFQSAKGLTADGEVGLATWNALFSSSSNSTGSSYTRLLKVTSPLMYGEDIKAVQNKLNSLGYNCGTADGYYGNATKNAVISFQSAKGIDTDGVVGPTTWKLLFNSSSNGSDYSRILKVTSPLMYGDDVKAVQNKLNSLGYNCGTADGYYGNATKSAVISFQSAKGLTADGEVGPATWNALFNSYSSSGSGTLPGGSIKVFIDAGHGGTDPGAVGNGLKEKDIVLSIATKLGALLNGRGISIKYSRTTDTYLSLEERARLANAWGADLFVSIHANSATSSVRGTECYTHPTANTATKTLSGNVSRAIASKFGISNRGHKEANFAVLRLSNMPAILVETAFISNSSDANLLNTRQADFSVTIANSILSYFSKKTIDISYVLSQAKNIGLLKGTSLEFALLEAETPIKVVSVFPTITMSASVAITRKLNSLNSTVMNFAVDSNGLSAQFINKLGENRIDFSQKNKDNLAKSIEKIGVVIPSGIFNVQAYTSGLGAIFKIEYPITIDNLTFYHAITISVKDYNNPSVSSFSFALAETTTSPSTNTGIHPLIIIVPGVLLAALAASKYLLPAALGPIGVAASVLFIPIIYKINN